MTIIDSYIKKIAEQLFWFFYLQSYFPQVYFLQMVSSK